MAKTITVSTIATPTWFAWTPVIGVWTLPAWTYYYKIMAVKASYWVLFGGGKYSSAPSAEIAVVLGGVWSINFTWTAVAWASGYMIFRTPVSGNYTYRQYSGWASEYYGKCLRPTYSEFSATTNAYTDTGAISTSITTNQGESYWDYFDHQVPLLNCTGGDVADYFNFDYLYSQDVLNGWGYITRTWDSIIWYTYTVKANITCTSAWYWREPDSFDTFVLIGWGFECTHASSTTIMGTERATWEYLYGKRFILPASQGYYGCSNVTFAGNTTLYGTTFITANTTYRWYTNDYQVGRINLSFTNTYTLGGCTFIGTMYATSLLATGAVSSVKRCNFYKWVRTLNIASGDYSNTTMEDISIADDALGIHFEAQAITTIEFIGGSISTSGWAKDVQIYYSWANLTLVDTIYDSTKVYCGAWFTGTWPWAQFHNKNRVDIKVLDYLNNPIVWATVSITNNLGTQVDAVTDSNGNITQQKIETFQYVTNTNATHFFTAWEKTSYWPFTIRIRAPWYKEYVSKQDISSQVKSIITLHKNKQLNFSNKIK